MITDSIGFYVLEVYLYGLCLNNSSNWTLIRQKIALSYSFFNAIVEFFLVFYDLAYRIFDDIKTSLTGQ